MAEEGGIEPRAPLDAPMFSKQVPEPSGLHLPYRYGESLRWAELRLMQHTQLIAPEN